MKNSIKRKCPSCEHSVTSKMSSVGLGIVGEKGQELTVKGRSLTCKNCGYSWMTSSDAEKLEEHISKASWHVLKPEQVAELRESLGLKTKTQAAVLLGLNHKAFSKWEQGYNELNFSTDLLLRLASFSEENLNFIRKLHAKDFAYDPTDYQLVCKLRATPWNGQAIMNTLKKSEFVSHEPVKFRASAPETSMDRSVISMIAGNEGYGFQGH